MKTSKHQGIWVLVLSIMALGLAFFPLLNVMDLVLVPACLAAVVSGLTRTLRPRRGLATARLYIIALLLLVASVPVHYFTWQQLPYCASLDHHETLWLMGELKKRCAGRCCADQNSAIYEVMRSRFNISGKTRAFHFDDIKDGSGRCTGYEIHFTCVWPCHDDDWSWSSKEPRVFKVRRGGFTEEVDEALRRLDYTFEVSR